MRDGELAVPWSTAQLEEFEREACMHPRGSAGLIELETRSGFLRTRHGYIEDTRPQVDPEDQAQDLSKGRSTTEHMTTAARPLQWFDHFRSKHYWLSAGVLTLAATILFLLMRFAFPPTPTHVVAQFEDVNRTIQHHVDGKVTGHKTGDEAIDRDVAEAVSTGIVKVPERIQRLARDSFDAITREADHRWTRPQRPVGEAVDSPTPTFHWVEDDAQSWYRVFIYDDDLEAVAVSPPLRDAFWALPEQEALTAGAKYHWEVLVQDSDEPRTPDLDTPKAAFHVLTAEDVADLRQALSAASDCRIARAVVYAKFGLISEALTELNQLEKLNPESSLIKNMANKLREKELR